MRDARLDFIDTAKAIGIVLVVLGHLPGVPKTWVACIYTMHMPLFFFLSGYLSRPPGSGLQVLIGRLSQLSRSLLVPYAFFFAVSMGYWLATRTMGARAAKFANVTVADALMGALTGLSVDLLVNPTLWFFPCLWTCACIFTLLRWRLPAAGVVAVAMGLALPAALTLPWTSRLPWGMDIIWVVLPFYAAGHWLSGWRHLERMRPAVALTLAVPAVCAWWALAIPGLRVDLAQAHFGPGLGHYLAVAAAGIAGVLLLARCLPGHRGFQLLARTSLVVFPLHALLLNMVSGATAMAALPPLAQWGPWGTLLLLLFNFAVCVPLGVLLERQCPRLLGRAGHAVRRPARLHGSLPSSTQSR